MKFLREETMQRDIFVAVLMGSKSDYEKVEPCIKLLSEKGVPYETRVLSAHRTPLQTREYVIDAEKRGAKVFICAAGMAAHLAGVVASYTTRPVIGIPISSGALNGVDALYSTVMMPPGVPVATVAINGSQNAGYLALQIVQDEIEGLEEKLKKDKEKMKELVLEADASIK
jgi:5-(carboxyamino)imidazole ribonucleotide mutase